MNKERSSALSRSPHHGTTESLHPLDKSGERSCSLDRLEGVAITTDSDNSGLRARTWYGDTILTVAITARGERGEGLPGHKSAR